MKLIGMLDSPYVRRVAISLQLLGLEFEHDPLSVFRTFAQFQAINPVVKAPTLICDDGTVLMDSTLILDYAEALAAPGKSLMPTDIRARRQSLRVLGLALAACEKSVQIIYERNQRPAEKVHAPWMARVTGQLLAAYDALESELARAPLACARESINQAGITVAVAWHFTMRTLPETLDVARFPRLSAFSDEAEKLAEFVAAPYGDTTFQRR